MCLAQGPQRSDAGEARTRGPSVSSQALYHWATALPFVYQAWLSCIALTLLCVSFIYSKTCLSGRPKVEKIVVSNTAGQKYCIMLSWSILQYFWPALYATIGLWNPFFLHFLSGRLWQVLLYPFFAVCACGIYWSYSLTFVFRRKWIRL